MFTVNPIKFGTDGWRGVIAADFTFERVALLAPLAAQVLSDNYGTLTNNSRLVIVGYDRRFMAEDFAKVAAQAIQAAGFYWPPGTRDRVRAGRQRRSPRGFSGGRKSFG
jgi:phosphomannomutase